MKKLILFTAVFFLLGSSAWATQEHADPEGLYSHLIAHLFFMFSMLVLIVQIKRTYPLPEGWKYIGVSAFLFLLWNIDVFTVHLIREHITPGSFTGSAGDWGRTMDISTLKAGVFYAGKILDHFLSVGALAVFITGLRAISRKHRPEEEGL